MVYLTFVTFLPLVLITLRETVTATIPRLAMPCVAVLAGIWVFAFVHLGKQAFELLDPTRLRFAAFDELIYWTDQVSIGGHDWQDRSFQNHANKRATDAIIAIEAIADYSTTRDNLRRQPLVSLTSDILRFLVYYAGTKLTMPTDSFWYERTLSHPD